jgi:molybdopterin synthase catalytic subunit
VVQAVDFEPGREIALLGDPLAGGIASFVGVVRAGAEPARQVVALTLEHYPGMTEKALERIAAEAETRWELTGCTILHRVGRLAVGEHIVFVGTASAHRDSALQACAFLIDWLKTSAPFWKMEELDSGEREWVVARVEDEKAVEKWEKGSGSFLKKRTKKLL